MQEEGLAQRTCSVCTVQESKAIERISYSEGLEYTLKEDGTYAVSGIGTCTDTDIVIPSMYNGEAVTAIGRYAFNGCTGLTQVHYSGTIAQWNAIVIWFDSGLRGITIICTDGTTKA